ncbi:MAG: hypothetical protein DRH24_16260 [Deltaproteobacteria bacterium]|nr:MAG: hypothetical protein DRH24_16260 [Deltaproteobacteria bacterium]
MIRTNVVLLEPDKEQEEVLKELGDACAVEWNVINYERRQVYHNGGYIMEFKNERERWIWLAGIIDCEGGLWIEKFKVPWRRGIAYKPLLSISNTNRQFLQTIKRVIGHGYIRELPHRNDNWKEQYELCVTANGIRNIVPNILPFLVIKRQQALLIIEAVELTGKIGKTPPHLRTVERLQPYYNKLEEIYLKIKELNRRGR